MSDRVWCRTDLDALLRLLDGLLAAGVVTALARLQRHVNGARHFNAIALGLNVRIGLQST